jgi:hypothetical protein
MCAKFSMTSEFFREGLCIKIHVTAKNYVTLQLSCSPAAFDDVVAAAAAAMLT